jgi:pimeloyl-ACP methyl ester carboxylesterase
MTRGAGDRGRTADGVSDAQPMRDPSTSVRTTRRWATAGALLLVVGACSGDDDDGSAPTTTVDSAATQAPEGDYELTSSGVPRVEEGDCVDRVPTTDRVRCLTLVVPESRGVAGAGSERLVRLPVVIVAAQEPSERLADPVLWIDYGPGDGFVAGRARNFIDEANQLNRDRDVITLDLRGSGLAEPTLACPEVTDLNTGAFAAEIDETSPEGRTMRLDTIRQCHDRLVDEGVDLSAFASADAAEDLEDLRLALGVERWNLVVGEYGSRLAQILARDHPEGVRSVVVNSTPVPLQADWFADLAPNAARGWSALIATCEADAGCAQAFPDLAGRLDGFVADLAANPRRFDEVQLDGPVRAPFLLTSSRLLSYVRFYGRVSQFLGEMPMSVAGPPGGSAGTVQTFDPDNPDTLKFQASDAYFIGAWGLWELFPQNATAENGSYALGAHLSAVCRDEAPFTEDGRLAAAASTPLFGPFLGRHADLEACDVWAVDPSPASANEAVRSDVPFLVFAGDLDTVSSPEWADAFSEGLSDTQVVHFAGLGTQPTGPPETTAQQCARQLRDAFLAEPTAPVDDACVATSHGPAFSLP